MKKLILFLIFFIYQTGAQALPILSDTSAIIKKDDVVRSEYDFLGIIGLRNCSGALIKFKGDDNKNRKAMMMTNGHCMGVGSGEVMGHAMPPMGEVIEQYSTRRWVELFHHGSKPKGELYTTKIIYGTMTSTDLAIYELEMTYQEIEDKWSITPLVLADKAPQVGSPLEIITGFWRRGYSCYVNDIVYQLQEAQWVWDQSIHFSQPGCETIGGTSGAPIISSETREVIGINNTGNVGGEPCSFMNPCEISQDGTITSKKDENYGQQTYWVYSCLDENFQINLDIEGCMLPKRFNLR